ADPRGAFRSIAGLAIGFTITLDIFMGGPYTGAAMNPARAFGPQLVQNAWSNCWVWYLGPVIGAALAALAYEWLYLRPLEPEPVAAVPGPRAPGLPRRRRRALRRHARRGRDLRQVEGRGGSVVLVRAAGRRQGVGVQDPAPEDDLRVGDVHLRRLERRQGPARPRRLRPRRAEEDVPHLAGQRLQPDGRPEEGDVRPLLLGPRPQAGRNGPEGDGVIGPGRPGPMSSGEGGI